MESITTTWYCFYDISFYSFKNIQHALVDNSGLYPDLSHERYTMTWIRYSIGYYEYIFGSCSLHHSHIIHSNDNYLHLLKAFSSSTYYTNHCKVVEGRCSFQCLVHLQSRSQNLWLDPRQKHDWFLWRTTDIEGTASLSGLGWTLFS